MSHVHRRVTAFCHGTDSQCFDHILFRRLCVFHQFIHGRRYLSGRTRSYAITELGDKAAEIFQLFGIRLLVNTIHECFGFWFSLTFPILSATFCWQKHKFLDQLVGLFRAFEIHARGFPFSSISKRTSIRSKAMAPFWKRAARNF